jgi:hypothetical protein
MVAKSKKQNRLRKNKTRRSSHSALRPENALRFFKTLSPVLTKFLQKHNELRTTIEFYKGFGYRVMNQFLNFQTFEKQLFGTTLYLSKYTMNDGPWKTLYDAAYTQFESNPSDYLTAIKAELIYTLYEIQNLRRAFKLFNPPKQYTLPTLYRGLSISEPANQPFHGISSGESITMKGFQSCSLSIETAISFQTCSSNGPCCLFVMTVDPAVKFLPLFWSNTESYENSEHEVVLEPFTQFQLDEKRTEYMPIEVARKCGYNRFNADGTITIDVYYITVKPPSQNACADFDDLTEKMKTTMDSQINGLKITAFFN